MGAHVTILVVVLALGSAVAYIDRAAVARTEAGLLGKAAKRQAAIAAATAAAKVDAEREAEKSGRLYAETVAALDEANARPPKVLTRTETVTEVVNECTWDSELPGLPQSSS